VFECPADADAKAKASLNLAFTFHLHFPLSPQQGAHYCQLVLAGVFLSSLMNTSIAELSVFLKVACR